MPVTERAAQGRRGVAPRRARRTPRAEGFDGGWSAMADEERPELEKEVVTLPDGRRLIYYWFATTSPRPRPSEERREAPPSRTRGD